MQSLEKRLIALEAGRGSSLATLTDEELDARIAVLDKRIAAAEAADAVDLLEACHAEH